MIAHIVLIVAGIYGSFLLSRTVVLVFLQQECKWERGGRVRKRIQQNSCMQPTGFLIGELVDTIRKSHWKGRIRWQRAQAEPWYLSGCKLVLVLEVCALEKQCKFPVLMVLVLSNLLSFPRRGGHTTESFCKSKTKRTVLFKNGAFAVEREALLKLMGSS